MMWITASLLAWQVVVPVGPEARYRTVSDALANTHPFDTVLIAAGIYNEHLRIEHPVTVIGQPGTIVDGGGTGRIIEVLAPATVQGLIIRGSGRDLSREDAGIWVDAAHGSRIINNVLEDVLFGIYVKRSRRPVITGNYIEGKPLATQRRGDGIRLWYSPNGIVADNHVANVRDVVIWFSDSTLVERNTVTDSRYGLHYMYSDYNRFLDNRFERNEVGAFLMYSQHVVLERNVFAYARGPFGKGIGFKDADDIRARSNLITKNTTGIFLDNSPNTTGVFNTFSRNVVAFNDVGMNILPSVRDNHFLTNTFLDNVVVAAVTGRGSATSNTFYNNYWSEYAGLDDNKDGYGDTPYASDRVTDNILSRHEALQIFRLSTATSTLDMLARLVPVLKSTVILVDSSPSLTPFELGWATADEESADRAVPPVPVFAILLFGLGIAVYRRRVRV